MQNRVLVLDKNKQPLMPCHPARARQLLKEGKAAVFRRKPFTIILKEREGGYTQDTQVKVDPGSKTTGIAVVVDGKRGPKVIIAIELEHRGHTIKKKIDARRAVGRGRRNRKTRYRKPRFNNRKRKDNWLPPSLQSRVSNIETWVDRLRRWCPATHLAVEHAKFDMQKMERPEIASIEYQQGTLAGYEVREYLLEKWGRKCVYCGVVDVPLEVEHIIPKGRNGTNRVDNLTIACHDCNQQKGSLTAAEFGFPELHAQAKRPLRDAAAVNTIRWAVVDVLKATGLPVEIGTGGRTKFNRCKQGYPKTHWLDAACVGASGTDVYADPNLQPLHIKATGH